MSAPLPAPAGIRLLRVGNRAVPRLASARGSLGLTAVLLGIAFLVLGPIVLLAGESFQVGPFGTHTQIGLDNWLSALSDPALQRAVTNTLTLTLTQQAISMVVSVALAWLLARTDLPGRTWLEFGFWIAVFLPALTVTLGWIIVFDGFNGLANKLLQRLPFVTGPVFDIFSWWGIIWVHLVTTSIPIKVMLLTPVLRNIDPSFEEAARAAGAGLLRTLRSIVVPLLTPAILVVLVLSTIRSLEAFEVELVLGTPARVNVYSTLIYRRVVNQSPPQFGEASVLSLLILVIMLPLVLFQQSYARRHSRATLTGRFNSRLYALGAWRHPAFAAIASLLLLMTVVPMLLVLGGTFMSAFGFFDIPNPWTLRNWQVVLGNPTFIGALVNSLVLATGTALAAIVACTLLAYVIVRVRFWGGQTLDFLAWLPSALPGVIIGLGYLWLLLDTPVLLPLYGTTLSLILVTTLGSMTLTTQLVKTSLQQLGTELEEASRAHGAGWWYGFRRVLLPLLAPTLAAVGVLAFSSAARATSHVALLSSRSNQPLSVLQLNMMTDSDYGAASVVGVFILLFTVGIASLGRFLGLRAGLGE